MAGEAIVMVLHSSGSTGVPKAVSVHQEGVFKNFINQRELDFIFLSLWLSKKLYL
jgi:acyl-coenzyme A synthetase/AMP-(fatty) acid ligase